MPSKSQSSDTPNDPREPDPKSPRRTAKKDDDVEYASQTGPFLWLLVPFILALIYGALT
jgi:hypothetical protein